MNCTGTAMSEHGPTWQTPARAAARWTVVFMGWVWLGHEGQRLDWLMASGLVGVALWWGMRLVLQAVPGWSYRVSNTGVSLLGVTTAMGMLGLAQVGRSHSVVWLWLGLSVVWACWACLSEAERTPKCQQPWAGWPPVLAAGLTWAAIGLPEIAGVRGLNVCCLLLLATVVQTSTARVPGARLRPVNRGTDVLPQMAMGLMMGSLWIGSTWCFGTGWPAEAVVGVHLCLMAGMPVLARAGALVRVLPVSATDVAPLSLVTLGALVLQASASPLQSLFGMVLITLAWALRVPHLPRSTAQSTALWQWLPLCGPLLLLWVGHTSQSVGPQALTHAFGLLGVAAFVALAWAFKRVVRAPKTLPSHL
jgi:hypothetical protein